MEKKESGCFTGSDNAQLFNCELTINENTG